MLTEQMCIIQNANCNCACNIEFVKKKHCRDLLVSCPNPALCEGKGLGTNMQILGCADSATPISIM